MSADVRTLGPTPVRANSFRIKPEHLSAASLRYQQIISTEDDPAIAFENDLQIWTVRTKQRAIRTAAHEFAAVLNRQAAKSASYRWPADARGLVTKLVLAILKQRQTVLRLGATSFPDLRLSEPAFIRASYAADMVDLQIKSRLGLPVTNPSAGSTAEYVRKHTIR